MSEVIETADAPRIADHRRAERYYFTFADCVFGVILVATVVFFALRTRAYGFTGDDWLMASRGLTPGDYFLPYNDHFSVIAIAVYHGLYETFGFGTYKPLRLVGIATSGGVAVAIFAIVRSKVGSPAALVAGTSMLWYPGYLFVASIFNHYLALIAIIVCAALLMREGRGADIALGFVLAFGLCSSDVAVAGGVGCVVYLALTRASRRRWLAVGIPLVAWAVWWRLVALPRKTSVRPPLSESLHMIRDGVTESFRGLVAGNSVLGALLGVFFVALLILRLRGGARAARQHLSWTVAFLFFWFAVSFSRTDATQYRYVLVGSTFVILALLPLQRPRWVTTVNPGVLTGAAIVIAFVLLAVNHQGISENLTNLKHMHQRNREDLIMANLGPKVVADSTPLRLGLHVGMPAGDVRRFIAKYGSPPGTRPSNPDAALLRLARVRARVTPDASPMDCVALGRSVHAVPPEAQLVLRASSAPVAVQVRRFSPRWVSIGQIPPGATATIDLPGLQARSPWMIQAPGACVHAGTTIQVPSQEQTVSGRSVVIAAFPNIASSLTDVEFRLTGGKFSDVLLGKAAPSFLGWAYRWDTTAVPNGRYSLTSVATDAKGNKAESGNVWVTILN